MKFYIICDFRDEFPNLNKNGRYYNDHPTKESVEEICKILCEEGYNCEIFGGINKLIHYYENNISMPRGIYINMSDGREIEYCRIQAPLLAEMLNIKLSGGNSFLCGLANNKYYTNYAVRNLGVLVPECILLDKSYTLEDVLGKELKYPVLLKPNASGSSIGIFDSNICDNFSEIQTVYKTLNNSSNEILIQEYIDGYEITNMLVGNKGNYILNEVILTKKENKSFFEKTVLTQDDKANKKTKDIIADKVLPLDIVEKIKETTIKIFEGLQYKDIIRVDYRVTKDFKIYFIELNTVPRISSNTEISIMCKNAGMSFSHFVCKYLESIQERFSHELE